MVFIGFPPLLVFAKVKPQLLSSRTQHSSSSSSLVEYPSKFISLSIVRMIELPLSVVAWISVVLVQAVVHYVVLGSRRRQTVGGNEDDATLEECLSLATVETTEDSDSSFNLKETGCQGSIIPSDPTTAVLMGEKGVIRPEPEQFFELLDLTGTELLKVCRILKHDQNNKKS